MPNASTPPSSSTSEMFPDCPESLTEDQLACYSEQGFLAFEEGLTSEEVERARLAITAVIEQNAFNEERSSYEPPKGESNNHSGAVFRSKSGPLMIQLEPGFTPSPERRAEIEPKVRKLMRFENEDAIFQTICATHPRIQGVLRSLLGPEMCLYQSMALIKPAKVGSEKPWHQDNAYFSIENLDALAGVWIALDDVSIENGAMHFLPGAHLGGPLKHYHTSDCKILPDRFSTATAVPVCLRAGGIIFFHGNAPHFTPANTSPHRRRALQFHYRITSNQVVSQEAYHGIFKEADGTPASCSAAVPENF